MFQKRIIELFTLLFYWLIIMPFIYNYCQEEKWIKWDMNTLFTSVSDHATFVLFLIAGYVVFYRIVIFIYMKMKVFDGKMWNNMKNAKNPKDPEAMYADKTHYKAVSVEELDTVDGRTKKKMAQPKMIRTISHPLLVEKDLAAIHIKHETRPLHSATLPRLQQLKASPSPSLRSAPPVPKTPGVARKLSPGVIMSPDVLLHTK
ncbi:uncharacterized protein Dwil_GK24187 [Drosophila willistoni]|uniref:Uncharacterized protein n=1 Tax=Drosophila willistoni TaxID=7260 RepID=B4N1D2_DROWI|nr:uncharacterized protein LOC6643901 [Drosophila willistoni]EDW78105.1 uncharacterized protein Dwil_GK24187 [Drosophila willistoni]